MPEKGSIKEDDGGASVPIDKLEQLITEWRNRGVIEPYGMTWLPPANELEEIISEHKNTCDECGSGGGGLCPECKGETIAYFNH